MSNWIHTVTILALVAPDTACGQNRPLPGRPGPAPVRWLPLIGEYGRERDTLHVYEDGGRLLALLTPGAPLPLAAISESAFVCACRERLGGDTLVFGGDGVRIGEARLPRLHLGPADGVQLRLTPVRPVADLLREDRSAVPPADSGDHLTPDLVTLAALDSTIRLDIRYATTNNFLGSVFYSQARAFLQRPAAEALLRVQRALRPLGYGLLIHDAYRPWYVTKVFWDATPPGSRWLVANPARGSKHNRGAAVDLTLYELATGRPVEMPSTYDEASPRALSEYPGGTSLARWHRALLRRVMEAEGFTVNPNEWWHFDYGDWQRYPILNIPIENLGR